MGKSNYDKKPATLIEGEIWKGWPPVLKQIRKTVLSRGNVKRCILAVECYHGVAIMGVSGGAFIPPLMGIVSDKFGQMAGLSVLLICLAYLSVLSFQSK